jgi:hypothetical protein
MPETASLQFEAIFRMQGESAFLDSVPVNKNPWPVGTEEHKAWCDGGIDESERSHSAGKGQEQDYLR